MTPLQQPPVIPHAADSAVSAIDSPPTSSLAPEPLPANIKSIQPGGGRMMSLELAWGRIRRRLLKTFAPRYVRRMRRLRKGDKNACPHEVLDPRDTKYFQNQGGYWWRPEDDPFAWRDRLPLVRVGLAEALLFTTPCLILAAALSIWHWAAAIPPALLALQVLWFFRNPRRLAPPEPGLIIAPADGRIVSIRQMDNDPFLGGPAVEIGIFLSIFNVHVNRVPVAARIIGLTYRPGKFLNALLAASARENERIEVRLEENAPPYRRFVVRQIAGAIASRIVCWVAPGSELPRGAAFGMIKFGSRTELVLPQEQALRLLVKEGENVRAGVTVLACFERDHSN
jgi:phosphatidylserine decarboxylase